MPRNPPPTLAPRTTTGPKVTVVMPTYRRPRQIGDTIRSILAQSLDDFELLVRDDGDGKDGTAEAVAAAANGDPRVHYARNPRNLRMPTNLNEGIRESRGEFIAVCHDHDLYHPDFLRRMVDALERHPTALFVHTAIEMIDDDGKRVATHVGDWAERTPGEEWLRLMLTSFSCPVCALTVVRRSTHEQHGLYEPRWGFVSDTELWMRLASRGDVAYIREPLIRVRTREADHFAVHHAPAIVKLLAGIHREYVPVAYAGGPRIAHGLRVEARAAVSELREHAARFRRRYLPRQKTAPRRE